MKGKMAEAARDNLKRDDNVYKDADHLYRIRNY